MYLQLRSKASAAVNFASCGAIDPTPGGGGEGDVGGGGGDGGDNHDDT